MTKDTINKIKAIGEDALLWIIAILVVLFVSEVALLCVYLGYKSLLFWKDVIK